MLPLLDLTRRLPERACELRPADVDDLTVQIGTAHSWPSGLYALSEERLPGSAIGCSLCCCYIYSLWTMLSASHDLDVAQDTKARMNLRGNSFRYKRIVAGETRLLIHCFMLPPLLETLVCYEPKALLCKLISLISQIILVTWPRSVNTQKSHIRDTLPSCFATGILVDRRSYMSLRIQARSPCALGRCERRDPCFPLFPM